MSDEFETYLHAIVYDTTNRGVMLNNDIIRMESILESASADRAEVRRRFAEILRSDPEHTPGFCELRDRVYSLELHAKDLIHRLEKAWINARYLDRSPLNQIERIFK